MFNNRELGCLPPSGEDILIPVHQPWIVDNKMTYSIRTRPVQDQIKPGGKLVLQLAAMPADTNPNGDLWWLADHMDMGAGIATRRYARSRVVTAAIDSLVLYSRSMLAIRFVVMPI